MRVHAQEEGRHRQATFFNRNTRRDGGEGEPLLATKTSLPGQTEPLTLAR